MKLIVEIVKRQDDIFCSGMFCHYHQTPLPQDRAYAAARKLDKWWFPKIGGTFFGVPRIRTIVYSGPYWGPVI